MIVFIDDAGNETSLTDNEELLVCQILTEATELAEDDELEEAAQIEEIVSQHLAGI